MLRWDIAPAKGMAYAFEQNVVGDVGGIKKSLEMIATLGIIGREPDLFDIRVQDAVVKIDGKDGLLYDPSAHALHSGEIAASVTMLSRFGSDKTSTMRQEHYARFVRDTSKDEAFTKPASESIIDRK